MKNALPLVLALLACTLVSPLVGQEPAREALRELTYEKYDDRVLAHLLALLPQARDAAQVEAAVDRWVADLDPADAVTVRYRIDQLLRETPEADLYDTLRVLAQHRTASRPETGLSSVSAANSSLPNSRPIKKKPTGVHRPPDPPVADFQAIGRLGSELSNAGGDCSEIQRIQGELSAITCASGLTWAAESCRNSRDSLIDYADQLLQAAGC